MTPEATALFLFAAVLLFGISAVLYLLARRVPEGLVSIGLACWALVPFWNALDAI